jgi:DNA-binding SARP family transcriptional activator
MTHLQVQVLGKLRLWHDDMVIDRFPTRRVEELLAFLLLNQRREHTREHLIDILWPDHPPSNGRASLSTALWRMNTVFQNMGLPPDQYLSSSRDWVSLEPTQPLFVDAVEFEGYLDRAEKEREREQRLANLNKAVNVYKGVFCDGIYSEWCLIERERLDRRYLWALGVLMADLVQKRSYQEAIAHGEAIISTDPLREEVHRALMLCFWKMGDSAGGIRQFQTCARLMQKELGILPLPETIDLYRNIIEDRVNASLEPQMESERDQRLRDAYQSFQSAAANLENLMFSEQENSEKPR